MKAWKICFDNERVAGTIECSSVIVSNREAAFILAEMRESDNVRIFPVDIKVKYKWSKEYDDR